MVIQMMVLLLWNTEHIDNPRALVILMCEYIMILIRKRVIK